MAIVVEIITDAVIIWLPIDLLYLYFAGGWSEPDRTILVIELVVLFLLPMFGMWRVYYLIRTESKRRKWTKTT